MLVYEFIPNGTLFDLIHGTYGGSPISLDTRLKIAQESAEALAYLHLSASPPIVHGDVKSPNILLGDNYVAKVTDFGASRILAKDEIQFITMVQGTLGYLDPEYLQENKLHSILDRNILSVRIELLQEVAQLAKCCLSMNGEERPLMIEVSERLRYIRRTWREQLIEHVSNETEYLPDYTLNYHPSSTGQHRSLMALDLENGR
ncbi:hypothetical protein PR202_gb15517 [Eleusine coracana subsp. coracana]|uniref:Protein kinase domain-containing protein n=1 Tax=Eleusine coracana subsp. coracana TaxID=191504 RepID=A0AAV5EVU0_ELECO|nr:hypothetical protein PR202_gb15517 [Eleusine coracana subsp. coracana]